MASNDAVTVVGVAGAVALATVGIVHVQVLPATAAVPLPVGQGRRRRDRRETRGQGVRHDDVRRVGGRVGVGHRDRVGHGVAGRGGGRSNRDRHAEIDRSRPDGERVGATCCSPPSSRACRRSPKPCWRSTSRLWRPGSSVDGTVMSPSVRSRWSGTLQATDVRRRRGRYRSRCRRRERGNRDCAERHVRRQRCR